MNGKNYSEEIKNQLTQNSKNIDERFFGNNSFSLVATEIFRDSLLIIKFLIVCVKYFYIFRPNL